VETLPDQRLHHIEPLDSAAYGDGGDVGTLETFKRSSRAKTQEDLPDTDLEGERAKTSLRDRRKWRKRPNVSTASLTDTSTAT